MDGNNQGKPEDEKKDKPTPIIAGFWRRMFAFIIDGCILGAVGMAFGTIFYDFFAELGGLGRVIGFAVAFLYFGILDSSLSNGQTIGKRILKIQVVNRETQTISLFKSFLRFIIIGIPYFFNGALIPPNVLSNPFISLILGVIVFFGSGAIIYLFIFNRKTRQSLHDLIIGTYVINTKSDELFTVNPIWKGHLAVVGVLFFTVVVLITFVMPKFMSKEPFSELFTVQKNIQESGLVHVATVTVGKSSGTNFSKEGKGTWESAYFATNAVLRHRPSDYDAVARQIASIIFETYPKIMEKDSVVINATYGYDIGIASSWKSQRVQHTPKEWKVILMQSHSEEKI